MNAVVPIEIALNQNLSMAARGLWLFLRASWSVNKPWPPQVLKDHDVEIQELKDEGLIGEDRGHLFLRLGGQ
jgi:hypothetical protein